MNVEMNEILKERIGKLTDMYQSGFEEICDFIFRHPELGGEETVSASYLAEVLQQRGFTVDFPYGSLPTAFIAEFAAAEPKQECFRKKETGADVNGCVKREPLLTIAFLAEYDALPGYQCKGSFDGNAHACGHNWIAAAMCGCGIVLSQLQEELPCRILVIGTPAEETFGAKYDMVRLGAFEGVDVAFQAHLDEYSAIQVDSLAMNSVEFTFKGVPAHAAQHPHKGINALDGVIAMFNGINAIREHLLPQVRIHGIITEGGKVTNVVPDYAVCRFSFRAASREYLKKVREKIMAIAEGAALMCGGQLSVRDYENPFDNMINVPELVAVTRRNLEAAGIRGLSSQVKPQSQGSSDIGNVSYVCPTLYAEISIEGENPVLVHEESALQYVNSTMAYRRLNQVIKGFACTAVDLCTDGKRIEKIKNQHRLLAEQG